MKNTTAILAAGDFPRKGGAAWRLLASARRVVACDSAAVAYRRHFRKWPTVVIGDLDSLPLSLLLRKDGPKIVHIPDQETNDLEKSVAFCRRSGWESPIIVGATGRREDHTLGNVFRALDLGCEIVTDCGRFIPLCGEALFEVKKGAPLSVFATDPKTKMTSKGLEWPLDGVTFRNLYCATLNRTTATKVTLTATRPVYIYLTEEGEKK